MFDADGRRSLTSSDITAMTALGQTLTSSDVCGTTASPPKADSDASITDVAEGPLRDIQTARRRNYSLTMRR